MRSPTSQACPVFLPSQNSIVDDPIRKMTGQSNWMARADWVEAQKEENSGLRSKSVQLIIGSKLNFLLGADRHFYIGRIGPAEIYRLFGNFDSALLRPWAACVGMIVVLRKIR